MYKIVHYQTLKTQKRKTKLWEQQKNSDERVLISSLSKQDVLLRAVKNERRRVLRMQYTSSFIVYYCRLSAFRDR